MLFKFYFKRAQRVQREYDNRPYGGTLYHIEDEKFCFSQEQFFTELDKAKAYAQRHTPIPLDSAWEYHDFGGGMYTAVAGTQSDWLEFTITVGPEAVDPEEPLAIPTDAELRFHDRDPD
jgi:hypothetical protein